MRIRIDKWLVVLAVVGLSTLSWWMPIEQAPVTTLVTAPEKRHIADFFLMDFDLTTMNAAGRPRYDLQADWMQHYSDDDTSQLTMPRLTVYRPAAPPWRVRADQAQVAAGGESVLLRDDVKVRRMAKDRRDALELTTSVLRVMPDKEYAETDQPVTVVTDLGVTRAIGMEADLKRRRLQLLAQVRGDYARQ
jgi:lipopolysaccharide export system protein LptC